MGDLYNKGENIAPLVGSKRLTGCECLETISCGGPNNRCISYKCPNDDKPISIFNDDDVQRFIANVGMGRFSSSGSAGQP